MCVCVLGEVLACMNFFSLLACVVFFFACETLCTNFFFSDKYAFLFNSEILIHYLCFCTLQIIILHSQQIKGYSNLIPRISHLTAPWGERGETLVWSGHVRPRIWDITIKLLKGGAP